MPRAESVRARNVTGRVVLMPEKKLCFELARLARPVWPALVAANDLGHLVSWIFVTYIDESGQAR